jgi:hypothetical protein
MRTRTRTRSSGSIFLPQGVECPGAKVFIAGKELVEGRHRIRFTHPRFEELVRNVTEKDVPSVFVLPRTLAFSVSSKKLCNTVGRKGATRLAHLVHLLNTQKESFCTVILVKNTLWAVDAYWNPFCGDWRVDVDSVASLDEWFAGDRVLSQV